MTARILRDSSRWQKQTEYFRKDAIYDILYVRFLCSKLIWEELKLGNNKNDINRTY